MSDPRCCVVGCVRAAKFRVFASYPAENGAHPTVRHYPAPMWHCCVDCIGGLMSADARSLMSTRQFVVTVERGA